MFIDDITEYLTSKLQEKSNNIIVGDFNMHIDDSSSNGTIIFNDTMAALGLDQHVKEPTHRLGNILDLVYTELSSELQPVICSVGKYVSDHRMVICELKLQNQKLEKKTLCIRKISAVSDDELLSTFDADIGHCNNLELIVPEFEAALKKLLDQIAPEKEITIKERHGQPWNNDYIKQQKTIVKNQEQKWIKYRLESNWKNYKKTKKYLQ